MTEPSRPSEISRLLFKAAKGLPEEEQAAVFEYFFERGIGFPQPPHFDPFIRERMRVHGAVEQATSHEALGAAMVRARKSAGPNHQLIPVRLSEDAHRRLKQWCAEHDFPMSVVVRGLVERFLDSWEERTA